MDSQFDLWLFNILLLSSLLLFSRGILRVGLSLAWGLMGVLFVTLTSELVGLPGVFVGRVVWTVFLLLGFVPDNEKSLSWIDRYGLSLVFVFLLFWAWLLRGLASIPSIADGGHHLYFFSRIQETLHALTGHIPLLRSARFGSAFLGFYPSGFHAGIAVVSFPAIVLSGVNPLTELQGVTLAVLALYPAVMYFGVRQVWPETSRVVVWMSAVWASLLMLFPLNPLGEGGVSRIAGLVAGAAMIFTVMNSSIGALELGALIACALPVLFWIHPASVLPVVLVIVIRFFQVHFKKDQKWFGLQGAYWAAIGCASVLSGAVVLGIMKSGNSDVLSPEIFHEYAKEFPLTLHAVLDRVKGPLHYFFEDAAGYGKFFSPRSLLADLGLFSFFFLSGSLRSKVLRPYVIGLSVLPWILALLVFVHSKPFLILGMFYYHSVKRISELASLPLFFGLIWGWTWLFSRLQRVGRPAFKHGIAALIFLSVVAVSVRKLNFEIEYFHPLYRAPRRVSLDQAISSFQKYDQPRMKWFCPTRDLQPLISLPAFYEIRNRMFFDGSTECISTHANDTYCAREQEYIQNLMKSKNPREVLIMKIQGDIPVSCWSMAEH